MWLPTVWISGEEGRLAVTSVVV